MIDEHVTGAEREHLDRVWLELQQHGRRGHITKQAPRKATRYVKRKRRRRGAAAAWVGKGWRPPVDRRWYPIALGVPRVTQMLARPALLGGTDRRRANAASPLLGAARFHAASANRKLSPVELVDFPGQPRPRPIPQGPFVSSTYASIEATCPDSCAFKRQGCFASEGFTKIAGLKMDHAARGRSSLEVVREEARLIRRAFGGWRIPQDGARGGRDLRLHVGGDVGSVEGARELGRAAAGWRARGGGAVWSYTHWWREIPRAAWGPTISVLASVERADQVDEAAAQGYPSAIVLERFRSRRAFPLGNGWRVIPCPAETGSTTCASCRLCLDRDLLAMRAVIGFEAHGTGAAAARAQLVQIGRRRP